MTSDSKHVIGVIHLPALPGHPCNDMGIDAVLERVHSEAAVFRDAGFKTLIVENFGDAPFEADAVAAHTVAMMTRCVRVAAETSGGEVGVNVLRNDARSALAVGAAAGARFIRVNVHTGVYATDQGVIEGRAAETIRERARFAPGLQIFADVHVKHAQPLSQPSIVLAAEETAYRGRADALIVTGDTTGRAADREAVKAVRRAVPDRPVLLGSGVVADSVGAWLELCDGVIVGSDLRADGRAGAPLDTTRVSAFARAAGL